MIPTYDGNPIFGTAVHVTHIPAPVQIQEDAYPGISGVTSLALGGRGRTFVVRGLLVDSDPFSLQFDVATLLNYADGLPRTFTDTFGNSWQNVRFDGDIRLHPDGPKPCLGGWCWPYEANLRGLS